MPWGPWGSLRLVCALIVAACGSPGRHAAAPVQSSRPIGPCAPPQGASQKVSATTGSIRGIVCDFATGEALPGVTVLAALVLEPSLPQVAISDENGLYEISGLLPGAYVVTHYYENVTVERRVSVLAGRTTPLAEHLTLQPAPGELLDTYGTAPTLDPLLLR